MIKKIAKLLSATRMKNTLFISLFALLISCNQKQNKDITQISADRWLEIDLYWFDKNDLQNSIETFWNRFGPLYEGVNGWKEVILNIGWLMDFIYEWKGNLGDSIPLPQNMLSEKYTNYTLLTGSTENRQKQWKQRFATIIEKQVEYEAWTYSDVKNLVALLKKTAIKKCSINDLRVGTLVLGWRNIYGGEESAFSKKHPQVYSINIFGGTFNPEALLNEDKRHYGAFPNGIAKGTSVINFFAGQWGDISKKVGFDAIVLRDGVLGAGIYQRRGAYGITAPSDTSKLHSFHNAVTDYIKAVKLANKNALIIGYSNAASAVADWRVNCFDLETVAKEGYMDAYIDQTWAGAWNEVGQRKGTFWNHPSLGWTYQMAFMLMHGAVLADSKVRQYSLVETFDAWEPWDIIHTAKERLRWGIWAFLNAGVKTPNGLIFPKGSYISWANQGKRLLSEEDVKFLSEQINNATLDARKTKEIFGPTLVYNRKAMEYINAHNPEKTIKEWIDEQAGAVMKWSIPIFSSTRIEYLPNIQTDLLIMQTPVCLDSTINKYLTGILKNGQPIAIWGSPAGGIDTDIAKIIGVSTKDIYPEKVKEKGALISSDSLISKDIPAEFKLYHLFSENIADKSTKTIYSVKNSPTLLLNEAENKKIIFWDPPESGENIYSDWECNQPIENYYGSIYPYVLSARATNIILTKNKKFHVEYISPRSPISVSAWQMKDSSYRVLIAELEEGINQSDDSIFNVSVCIPKDWKMDDSFAKDIWSIDSVKLINNKLHVKIVKSHSKLFNLNCASLN
jgi:hypothetical protein